VREHDFEPATSRGRRADHPRNARNRRFDDDDPQFLKRARYVTARAFDTNADTDTPETGDAWSSWDGALHGPEPWPDWVITDLGAVDTELGILKTGKEADVHLMRRSVPGTDRSVVLAAKRYREPEHRLFHRDAGYLEGRRVRRSRETRAMASRTSFGRQLIAGQWAAAEFDALARLWTIGRETGAVAVPYPVQLRGTELLLEFVGDADEGAAAPRLAQLRPEPDQLRRLWEQVLDAMTVLARAGLAHGDLSPYNVLVHGDRLVLIDLPQVVEVVSNPQGPALLARDVKVMATWFAARGLSHDPLELTDSLLREANMR
jgi:RIO kinase 1